MPGLQVVDLSPIERPREESNLEKTLGGFAKRQRENQIEERDTDALRDIYGKYQNDGRNLEKAIMDIQTRPGISPTTRVNSIKQLNEFQKHNQTLLKQTEREQKLKEHQNKKEEKKRLEDEQDAAESLRAEEALKKSGASEEQQALYKIAPVGGQTKIIGDVIESSQ